MAITKERLEELIKEGKTIYYLNNYYNKVEKIFLNYAYEIIDNDEENCLTTYDIDLFYNVTYEFDKLFETKEEAEFVQKFHTSKIVYFEPPTWEEFLKTEHYDFHTQKKTMPTIINIHSKYIYVEDFKKVHLILDLSKENYYKALEYAKKLFLGEKNG